MIQDKSIGIIGCGNMGSALVENLKKKASFSGIFIFDKDKTKQDSIAKLLQVKGCGSIRELSSFADVVIIAVKPQDIEAVLADLKDISDKLIISIAAGITLASLEAALGKNAAIIRAMPNLNALIGQSVTALCKNNVVSNEDLSLAKEIFNSVGQVVFIQESQMNAFTAVAGSGPAFVAYLRDRTDDELARILAEEAEHLGLDHNTATASAAGTITGTREMMRVNLDPDILIKRVCSKGGTTEAGMKVLEEKGKSTEALRAAIRAACKRAEELSRLAK